MDLSKAMSEFQAAKNGVQAQPVGATVRPVPVPPVDVAALQAANAALMAQLAALKASQARTGKLTLKVSEKGAVSVYGLGRFPVTLYQEQMLRLLDFADAIRAFIRDNATTLSTKGG